MGGGASVNTKNAEASEFADYRDHFHKSKSQGISNHEIFDRMSKGKNNSFGGEHATAPNRQMRAGSHQHTSQNIGTASTPRGKFAASAQRNSVLGVVSHDTKKHRRNQIFEDGFDFSSAVAMQDMAKLKQGVDRTKEVFQDGNDKLILEAIVNLFFIGEDCTEQMNVLIDSMEKLTLPSEEWLMREGEPGDTMYVIKSGKLEVYVGSKLMRCIGKGNTVGELALLYHTPRSASVKTIEACELFCLHRTKFREMVALSVNTSLVQRFAWIKAIPELEPLDEQSASRLAGAFSTMHLRRGEVAVSEGDIIERCFMIEHGTVEVTSLATESPELIEKQAIPVFPKTVTLASGKTEGQLGDEGGSGRILEHRESRDDKSTAEEGSRGLVLGPGVFLGMPVLLCAGKGKAETSWTAAPSEDEGFRGAVCPVSITAREDVRLSYFTPCQFESIVGPVREVFSQLLRGRPSLLKKPEGQRFIGKTYHRFKTEDFQTEAFLGTGSFGRVTLVRFKDTKKQEAAELGGAKHFALKALAKKAVIDRGQLAHVKDEKLLLQNMNHPLILGLFSTFQDKDVIYFLTEAVTGSEMWSIVYEGASGYAEGELPIEHGRFYAACVLEALAYMHERGVAYRDLKPENIMVDREGFPRVIDLGFAKKVPFTLVVEGKPVVHPKSFTMCGTPEYLAPEFIFNAGHDKSVDCWALGVLTYEFTAGYTPFQQPGEASDMTALFTRIASCKVAVSDSVFPEGYDVKATNKHSRDIVKRLLQADPTQRLGNLAGGMDEMRKHPYFAGIDWNALANKSMQAPWKPSCNAAPFSVDEGSNCDVPAFTGDDSVFENW